MLKRFVVVVAGLGFLSACGGGGGFAKLASDAADKICACKDADCVAKIEEGMMAEMAKMTEGKKQEDLMKEMASDAEKIAASRVKAEECKAKLAPKTEGEKAPE